MTIFLNFLKKYQVFGNFFRFKWQFSRGSGVDDPGESGQKIVCSVDAPAGMS